MGQNNNTQEYRHIMNKKIIITVLLATLTMPAVAQDSEATAESNPGWLWEISGNGLQHKSYLFGTCHGGGHVFTTEEVFGINGVVEAFDKVDAVFFESEMDPAAREISASVQEHISKLSKWLKEPDEKYIMPFSTGYQSLYDSISHFNEVDTFLTAKIKGGEYWKRTPGYWYATLSLIFLEATMKQMVGKAVDAVVYEEAVKRGHVTGHLEEVRSVPNEVIERILENASRFDTLSVKEQADSLYYAIHSMNNGDTRREFRKIFKKLEEFNKVYLENDTCKMSSLLEDSLYNENFDSVQHRQRNMAWIPVIEENIVKNSCMIAVGARHLLGDDSVIELLRREGYTVEPVLNKPSNRDTDFEYNKNHLYLNGNVNGKPARLVFDTGAPYILCLDSTFVAENGLTFSRTTNAKMGGAGTEQKQVKVIMGDVTLTATHKTFTPKYTPIINLRAVLGDKADGIFGVSGVAGKVMCINFKHGKMTIADSIGGALTESFERIPIEQKSNRILIPLTVQTDGKTTIAGKAQMDMGSGQGIVLTSKVTTKYRLEKIKDKEPWEYEVGGIGGHSEGYEFQEVKACLGNVEMNAPMVRFSTDKAGALSGTGDVTGATSGDEYLGIIGNKVWCDYAIIIDLKENWLYLKHE